MPRSKSYLRSDEKLLVSLLFRAGKTRKEVSDAVGRSIRQAERYRAKFKDALAQEAQDKLKAEHVAGLISPFRFPQDIGEGDHQVSMSHAEYALDAYDFYRTIYGFTPMVGLIKHCARIAAVRRNRSDHEPKLYTGATKSSSAQKFDSATVEAAGIAECYFYADLVEIVGGKERPNTDYLTFSLAFKPDDVTHYYENYRSDVSTRWAYTDDDYKKDRAERLGLEPFVMPDQNDAWFEYMPVHNEQEKIWDHVDNCDSCPEAEHKHITDGPQCELHCPSWGIEPFPLEYKEQT